MAVAPALWTPQGLRAQTIEAQSELARLRVASRILFRGATVLSMDPKVGDFPSADVLVEGGKLREIRPGIAVDANTAIIEAKGRIVLPGFVDTHHHFYQGLLRNILPNGLLQPDYSRDVSDRLTAVCTVDDVYIGTLISALGMIDMGTTCAVDTSQVNHTPEHSEAGIKALQDSGIRGVYAYSRGAGDKHQYPQDVTRLRKAHFNSADQLLSIGLAGTLVRSQFEAARAADVRFYSHGVNHRTEKALVELAEAKLLRPGDEYIHCTQLSSQSWRIIKESGGVVSLSPPIEMMMGHGMPGIQEALDNDIRPSLSSDVGVTFAQDPFTVMRSTITLQRLLALQRGQKNPKDQPKLLTARDVLEFATIDGANALGIGSRTGSLSPGKDADIVVLDASRLNVWPLNHASGSVVNLMNPMNVESVFIAGKVMKWRGALVGVDEQKIRDMAAAARDGVVKRAGFPSLVL
jgi:5-methylthioadenosine/S-adenosylhomocysteine deaminase